MHHLRITLFAALLASSALSQTNTFPSSGNVGIGTTNPASQLDLQDNGQHLTFLINKKLTGSWPASAESTTMTIQSSGNSAGNLAFATGNSEWMRITQNGKVGINTSSPSHELDVNGDTMVRGVLRVGELYFSPAQFIQLSVGTERWIKLATIPNNHYVRFHLRNGSQNSEEIAEVKVFGTYHNERTAISVERQTYNEHLREVRVVGSYGAPRTVYVKIRASDYAPSVSWRALDSRGAITIHNIEETPGEGLSHYVSGNLVTSTNTDLVTTGNVGIGTAYPYTKLHVAGGDILVSDLNSDQTAQLILDSGSGAGDVLFKKNSALKFLIRGNVDSQGGNLEFQDRANGYASRLYIAGSGNVGIGTTDPQHKLAVNGTIKAKEIIVETTGWSDYVFADNYRLAPLAEVEAHIKTKKHLPGIPSAAQVAESGVNLGDVQAALLAKVEELTLHLIAQEKNMQTLQKQNDALQRRVSQLETR